MGMFDGAFSFSDPNSMALLGMLSGLGQSASASRLPVTFGSALGSLAGGAMQGSVLGQEAQLKGQEAFGKQLQNTQLLDNLRLMALGYGLPAPTMADIQSGKYQGLFTGGLPKSLTEGLQTPITQPGAPAALPQVPQASIGEEPARYASPAPGVGGALPRAAAVYAQKNGVDPNFYTSVIDAESSFNPMARNPEPVGKEHATGIAQFLPSTARQYGVDPLNPEQSLDGGARYYADLLKQSSGDYIKAAQAYGTLPKDLGKSLNSKQQKVLQVAQALNSGQSFTDAGSAQAVQLQAAPAQQLQGGAMFAPDTMRAMLNANMKRYMGYQLTPVEQSLLAASMAPAGSQQRALSEAAALKAAGIDQFKGGERPGNPIFKYNPTTGAYEVSGLNPATAPGSAYIPGAGGGLGGIVQIPGATAAERAFAVAKQLPGTPMGAELRQGPQGLTMGLVPGAPEAIGGSVGSQAWGGVPAKLYEAGQTPRTLSPTESLVVPGQMGAPSGGAGLPAVENIGRPGQMGTQYIFGTPTAPSNAGHIVPPAVPSYGPRPPGETSAIPPGARPPSPLAGAQFGGPPQQSGVLRQGLNPLYAKGVETAVTADQERISKELTPMVDKANDQMATAQLIGDLLPRVATGWGAETKLEAARVMKGLGVSDDTVKNFLGTNAASGDVLQKQFLAQTAQAVRVMGAREPGSVISLFGKAYPNLATQPGAISLIENVLTMQGQRAHDQFALAQQHHSEQINGLSSGQPYVPLSKFESEFNTGAHSSVNYLKAAQALASDKVAWQGLNPEQVNQVWSLIPVGKQYLAPDGTQMIKR